MIQDRNAHREMASSSSGLLTSGGEVVNEEEIPVHRTDQILTLGSREVGISSSILDSVEALVDSIAESLNQHEQDLPEPQREKIVQILDRQITDTYDAHLENTIEFNFEEVDSDIEERVNDPDMLPLAPEKEKKLSKIKISSGFFMRKTKWERYIRVSESFLEESEKEIFPH